jgi:hypothetical protein
MGRDDEDDGETPDLFTSHARGTDPLTSHEAAASISIRAQALQVLRSYWNDRELIDHAAYRLAGFPSGRTSHQRCSDLRAAGFIERTGGRGQTPSGRSAYLCRITEQGRKYLILVDG